MAGVCEPRREHSLQVAPPPGCESQVCVDLLQRICLLLIFGQNANSLFAAPPPTAAWGRGIVIYVPISRVCFENLRGKDLMFPHTSPATVDVNTYVAAFMRCRLKNYHLGTHHSNVKN
jgi:hypothetical protein